MRLTRVTITITGADDLVDLRALAELSEEYPFVEWGLLLASERWMCGGRNFAPTSRRRLAGSELRIPSSSLASLGYA